MSGSIIRQIIEKNQNTIVKINNKIMQPEFFQGFNWEVFNYNELVYLDDCDETNFVSAYFRGIEEIEAGRIVQLVASSRRYNLKGK